jgi:hypothetical protein
MSRQPLNINTGTQIVIKTDGYEQHFLCAAEFLKTRCEALFNKSHSSE